MSWINKSITRKVGLYIFFVIFALLAAYYFFLNVQLRTYYKEQSETHMVHTSEYFASEIEAYLQRFLVIVQQAKMNPDLIDFAREADDFDVMTEAPLFGRVKKQLIDISGMDENIALAYIALSDVNDLLSSDYDSVGIPDYDLSQREWYASILKQSEPTITPPYMDLVRWEMTVTIAAPLMDGDKILGVFALDIMIETLGKMMYDHTFGESGYTALAYQDGRILYHPDYSVKTPITLQDIWGAEAEPMFSDTPGIASCVEQGEEKLVAHLPIERSGLVVLTVIPRNEVYAQLNLFLVTNLMILFLALFMAIFLLLALRNLISAPVVNVSREIESFRQNKKEISIPSRYLNRKDEIGVLSRGLAQMANEISNYIVETEEQNRRLACVKEKISIERSLFKTTIHSLADGVIATDGYGVIQIMNNVAESLTKWPAALACGRNLSEVFAIAIKDWQLSELYDIVYRRGLIFYAEDILLTKKTGEHLLIEGNVAPIKDGEGRITGAVIVFRDFTEKKQRQEEILYLSYHDQLTGLYNQRFCEEELLRLDTVENLPLSVAMVDVNGLKLTNDAFGHAEGDKLLIRVATVLSQECRETDVVARVGGDEFLILMPKTTSAEAEAQIKRIYHLIAQEEMGSVVVSISVGSGTKTQKQTSVESVISQAEEQMYQRKLTESMSMRSKTIQAIFNTLREKNTKERLHGERVSKTSRELARRLGLREEQVKEAEYAGLMHDIGKIAISDRILNKPGALTDVEYQEIKRHPEIGYQILKSVDTYSPLAVIVLSHHERWDGAGYPQGLKGEDIPLVSRIIAVAGAFEAMTGGRPYRETLSPKAAAEELQRNAGTQFDPEIVRVMLEQVLPDSEETL